jgi:hypothetical protein
MDAIRYAVQTYGAKHWFKKETFDYIKKKTKTNKYIGF